jgi:hypothetical protein
LVKKNALDQSILAPPRSLALRTIRVVRGSPLPAVIDRGHAGFPAEELKLFSQKKTEETEMEIKIPVISVSFCQPAITIVGGSVARNGRACVAAVSRQDFLRET